MILVLILFIFKKRETWKAISAVYIIFLKQQLAIDVHSDGILKPFKSFSHLTAYCWRCFNSLAWNYSFFIFLYSIIREKRIFHRIVFVCWWIFFRKKILRKRNFLFFFKITAAWTHDIVKMGKNTRLRMTFIYLTVWWVRKMLKTHKIPHFSRTIYAGHQPCRK